MINNIDFNGKICIIYYNIYVQTLDFMLQGVDGTWVDFVLTIDSFVKF